MSYPNLAKGVDNLSLSSERDSPRSSATASAAAMTPPLTSAQPVQASLKKQVSEKKGWRRSFPRPSLATEFMYFLHI